MTQFQQPGDANEHDPDASTPDQLDPAAPQTPAGITPSIATEPEGSVGSGLNPP